MRVWGGKQGGPSICGKATIRGTTSSIVWRRVCNSYGGRLQRGGGEWRQRWRRLEPHLLQQRLHDVALLLGELLLLVSEGEPFPLNKRRLLRRRLVFRFVVVVHLFECDVQVGDLTVLSRSGASGACDAERAGLR